MDVPEQSLRALRRDRVFILLATGAAGIVTAAFLWIVGCMVARGGSALSLGFLTEAPARAGLEGGISTVLVSTAWILVVCLAVSVPLGLGTALFLSELTGSRGGLGPWVRTSLDVLAGVPSIVFGLFGNALFCVGLGMGYSILAGGLTLACMVLPFLIRSIEVALRGVPEETRRACAALDLSRATSIRHVLLPAALPGLAAGLLLGIGRASAETAALLFTSGAVDRMPGSLLDSGRTLSIHIWDLSMNLSGGETNAQGAALVLLVLLLAINGIASAILDRFVGPTRGRLART